MLRTITLILTVACITMAGCDDRAASTENTSEKPTIVASIAPLASLVSEVAGEDFQVITLLPARMTPHDFDPTPKQMMQVADARALISVGMGLDPWARELSAAAKTSPPIVTLLDLAGPHEHRSTTASAPDHGHDHNHHGAVNPHLWLDPVLMQRFVTELAPALAEIFPEHADGFAQRAKATVKRLEALDAEFKTALQDLPRRELVTFHNAFDPLAERYNLTVVAHLAEVELQPGGEVTPIALTRAIEQIRKHQLPVIYAEPQFPDQAVRAIEQQLGVAVLTLDPMGDPASDEEADYFQMMQGNLKILVRGQSIAATPEQ